MTSQSDGNKPANQTAKIIPFKAPRADYCLQCPDCEGVAWNLIMVDVAKGLTVSTLQCATDKCEYWTMGTLQMGEEHYD